MSLARQILLVASGMVLGSAMTLTGLRFIGEPVDAFDLSGIGSYPVSSTADEKPQTLSISPSSTPDWVSALNQSDTTGITASNQTRLANTVTPVTSPSPGALNDEPLTVQTVAQPTLTPTLTRTPIPPTPTSLPVPSSGVHLVQAGESLMSIAQQYGVSANSILETNGLKQREFIWMGQELIIPTSPDSSQPAALETKPVKTPTVPASAIVQEARMDAVKVISSTPQPAQAAQPVTHLVQRGETLAKIAERYGSSIDAIVALNDIPDRNMIEVGEEFTIPTDKQDASGQIQLASVKVLKVTPIAEPTPVSLRQGLAGKIVFQTSLGGDIFIIKADGSGLAHLTSGMEPSLSPDGQQVVFTRWGEQEGIYAIRVDGSGERLIYPIHQPRQAVWSPDGKRIAFSFQNGSRDIESHDENGKLYRNTEYFWRVAVVNIDGNNLSELPTSSNQSFSPTWSPDSRFVAFTGGEGLIVSAPGGFYRELTHGAWYESPVWSPAGNMIAYMLKRHDHFDIFLRPLEDDLAAEQPFLTYNKGIDQIALTSTPLFADGPVNNVAPAWSPDGQNIAFLSDRDGRWEIYVMDASGDNQRKLFDDALNGIDIRYDFVRDRALAWGN